MYTYNHYQQQQMYYQPYLYVNIEILSDNRQIKVRDI